MSSPPRYRKTFSPIRGIDERYSPSRDLDVILEESVSSKKSVYDDVGNQPDRYRSKISVPTPTYRSSYSDTRRLVIQNDLLKSDNQILASSQNYQSILMNKQIDLKHRQVDALQKELLLITDRYEKQLLTLQVENESLRKNLVLIENQKFEQIARLKQRYLNVPQQKQEELRKSYETDITKALMELETTHVLLNQKEKQLQHLTLLCKQNSSQYAVNLQGLVSENNILKNKLLQFEISAEKQIREMTAKKQLEKSRTQGIISYCKENTFYIQKEISRLADELLKKNISIESFNRQLTKYQKLIEEQGRRHEDQVYRLKKQHEEILNDKENSFTRYEKQFKLDLAEKKKIEIELIEKISSMDNQIETLTKKLDFANQTIGDKDNIIKGLKDSIQRKQEDHAKEINKVMSESKIKRKSMKNLSSLSSFKDIQQSQGSSIIRSNNLKKQQSIMQQGGSSHLPIVTEEDNMTHSRGVAGDDHYDLKEIIVHYESVIEELKRNKLTQLSIANNKIQALKVSLNEKQQQILDLLGRFSPLMEYRMSQEDIEQERRRKIEENQKADIDLLDVMLRKYDIVALRRR